MGILDQQYLIQLDIFNWEWIIKNVYEPWLLIRRKINTNKMLRLVKNACLCQWSHMSTLALNGLTGAVFPQHPHQKLCVQDETVISSSWGHDLTASCNGKIFPEEGPSWLSLTSAQVSYCRAAVWLQICLNKIFHCVLISNLLP